MVSLIAATGLRIGELLGLRWRAVDLTNGTLAVRVGATYPLAEAAQAHRDLEGRLTTGKVLLLP